jgi:hypothetical protein
MASLLVSSLVPWTSLSVHDVKMAPFLDAVGSMIGLLDVWGGLAFVPARDDLLSNVSVLRAALDEAEKSTGRAAASWSVCDVLERTRTLAHAENKKITVRIDASKRQSPEMKYVRPITSYIWMCWGLDLFVQAFLMWVKSPQTELRSVVALVYPTTAMSREHTVGESMMFKMTFKCLPSSQVGLVRIGSPSLEEIATYFLSVRRVLSAVPDGTTLLG